MPGSSQRASMLGRWQRRTVMKRVLIIAAGCALLAGTPPAIAQSPPPGLDTDRAERRDVRDDRDGGGEWRRDDRNREEWRGYRDDGPRGPGGGWHHGRGWHGGHRGGAQFWLRSGETRLGVRCDPSEPMRACVDAATTLLDRARTLTNPGAGTTPPASSGTGAPPTR